MTEEIPQFVGNVSDEAFENEYTASDNATGTDSSDDIGNDGARHSHVPVESEPDAPTSSDAEAKAPKDDEKDKSEEKIDPELLKRHDAWVKMRKRNMRVRDERDQALAKLAELQQQQSQTIQAQAPQPVVPNAAPNSEYTLLRDPKTGREIPIYASYDALLNGTVDANQVAAAPQAAAPTWQAQPMPVYNNASQGLQPPQHAAPNAQPGAKQAEQNNDGIAKEAADQLRDTVKQYGQQAVDALSNMVNIGSLDRTMINAAARTGAQLGVNGMDLLYELIKDPETQMAVGNMVDLRDDQSKTIALSNLLYSRVAEKNRSVKSNATKPATQLPETGNLQTSRLSPEEAYERDQELCRRSQRFE